MGSERFIKMGRDPRRVAEFCPDIWDDRNDPDALHQPDKYDNDFIWDGETVDEEKT